MNPPLLHLDNVSRRYGAVTALHPLSLTITAGARHAIIGPNGAGKTTLLHLIAGAIAPTGGRILLHGRPVTRRGAAARADLGIGRTFQHPQIVDELSAADNVALALRGPGWWSTTARPGRCQRDVRSVRITAALAQVGLAGDAATPAQQLPYGRRRLLEIAMVIAARPRLLLLDEPSAGLDPAEISHLTTIIGSLPTDTTVILIDHHLPLVWDIAGTVTVLASGQHLATGPTEQIRADRTVHDAYFAAAPGDPSRRNPARSTAGPAVLTIQRLRAGYHGAPVLDHVDLSVTAGTVHVLLGRNGAGKSTLINVLAGLHPAHPGTQLRLHGTDLRPGHRAAGVALVPQGRRLWPNLTVAEHMKLAARRKACTVDDGLRWDITAVLDLLPALHDKQHRYPPQLSGGEQQMLALARALLQQPRLLLLDEPSEGLAPQVVDQLAAAITRITAAGAAVLLAEQNQHFAAAVADQISVLDAGRIAVTTTAADLSEPGIQARLTELLGVTAGASA